MKVKNERLLVTLIDGRVLDLPLDWFPRVHLMIEPYRSRVRVARCGISVRWPALDYELGVGALSRQTKPLPRATPSA